MELPTRQLCRCLPVGLLMMSVSSLHAEKLGPRFPLGPVGEQESARAVPRPLLAAMAAFAPISLRRAEEGALDALDAMTRYNSRGKEPRQIGIGRPMPEPIVMRAPLAQRVPPGVTADRLGVFAGSATGA
jgi:hypothetical protein